MKKRGVPLLSRYRHWFFGAALITLLADQVSKSLVRAFLPLGSSVPLLPNLLHFTHTKNPGAAFGLFPNAATLLIVVALFVSAFFLWLGHQGFDRRRVALATGMILGGALGNLIDRVRFGAVTDFVDIRIWPIFNIADATLTFGAFLLLWWGLSVPKEKSKDKSQGENIKCDSENEISISEAGSQSQ